MPTGPPTVGPPWSGPPAPASWSGGPPASAPLWSPRTGLAPPPARPVDPTRRGWQLALALLAVAVVVAVAVVALGETGSDDVASGGDAPPPTADVDPTAPGPAPAPPSTTTQPTTTTTAPPTRLLPAPVPPAETGEFAFIGTEADGDPVAWDPCETIQFVVNSRRAPPGAAEIMAEAMAAITEATGLVFEDRGATDEPPSLPRGMRDPARYGADWSPVLISWTDPEEWPRLTEEDAAGFGGLSWVSTGGGEQEAVTGEIQLDGAWAADAIASGDRSVVLHVVMHEIGHVVGLDHVDSPAEVMNDGSSGVLSTEWGPGDRAGLAAVGSGDCDPDT